MGFKCKRRTSSSKRKNVGCKGCKYYQKVYLGYVKQYRWMCIC